MIERVVIIGTGLIGSSIGLALREAGFKGNISGIDSNPDEGSVALRIGAVDEVSSDQRKGELVLKQADLIVLAVPVLAILDWMQRVAPILGAHQLVTDVGSTKLRIVQMARALYKKEGTARFLPGHPMAGKESGGAALAEAKLLWEATWLFTPLDDSKHPVEEEWRDMVRKFGSHPLNLEAAKHDELCAWVSHLPQMVSTALAALLEDTFGSDTKSREQIAAIGGRALRETTRLGASPYGMWRDVALSNTEPIAHTLHMLEQRLAHLRENLRTTELKEEFRLANEFRARRTP